MESLETMEVSLSASRKLVGTGKGVGGETVSSWTALCTLPQQDV